MPDETAKTELTDAEKDNFGGQPARPVKGYVANFDGDEIDGKRYALGDVLDEGIDAGTIAYLVQNGRITGYDDSSAAEPSGGESPIHGPGAGSGDTGEEPALNADQQAEADKLVEDNDKDALISMAEGESVEFARGMTKAQIAARIVAARNA